MHTGPQSGKFGVIHNQNAPITHMFNWVLDAITHTPETYYASNTKWGASRNPGVFDWTGNFSIFDGDYITWPGQFLYCMEFFTAPQSGVYGNVGTTYCGQGIIESNVLTWAWGPEQSLTQVVNVAANGCIAARNRVIDDTTVEVPAKMCGLQLEYTNEDAPSTWITLENVQQAVLTMSATNPSYVNSSTGCCTHRRPGNLDWNLACTLTDHRSQLTTREKPFSFRLWNNPTEFWELVYGIYASTTGVTADRQTGAIQSQIANYMMKAIHNQTMGHIRPPGGNPDGSDDVWPPVATVLTTPTAPGKPTGTQDITPLMDVDVTWAAPSSADADGYTIWASTDGIDFACVGCSASESFKDVGIPEVPPADSPQNLYYKISGYNAQGQGPFSEVSDAIPVTNLP